MFNTALKIAFLALLLVVGVTCPAQMMPDSYSESKSGKLEYGFYTPENYNPSGKYPLVMYLHGFSSNYTVYLDFYNRDFQAEYPCFVFSPRTPPEWADWSSWSWEGTGFADLSEPMRVALNVLDSLITRYPIDTSRLYVYGISMGGEGVFDLLHKVPGKFAAGISICGGGFAHWAEKISQTPFWMFHGSLDDVNPPDITERVYKNLVQMGAKKMRYTNYPGYGHEIWDRAQSEPSFYDWMFAFSKNQPACPPPQGEIKLSGTATDKIHLEWNDIRNPTILSEKIWYYNIYDSEGLLATVEYDKTSFDFTPQKAEDTFRVEAVNYCFAKSKLSNVLSWKGGKLTTAVPPGFEKKK